MDEWQYYDLYESIAEIRTQGFNGPDPIPIKTWMELYNCPLSIDEIALLVGLDRIFRNAVQEESDRNSKKYETENETGTNVDG